MRALFGDGAHPDRDAMLAAGAPEAATRLGTRYPTYQPLPPRVERVAAAAAGVRGRARPATVRRPSTSGSPRTRRGGSGGRWPATTWCSRR